MKNRILVAVSAFALVMTVASASAAELSAAAKSAVDRALEDEYRAEAFYAATIEKFGEVRPFSNIINAERTHAAALVTVMKSYGIAASANPYLGDAAIKAAVPATLAEACQMGVDAEIANRDLYAKFLLPAVAEYRDIVLVFENLRDASDQNHLPAFERCGGAGHEQGHGKGMGQGMGGMGMRGKP